jgi:hypothetical protein
MAQTKHIHIHLAITPEVAEKYEVVCREWRLKRPWALERMVDREYKLILKKRLAAQQPAQTDGVGDA